MHQERKIFCSGITVVCDSLQLSRPEGRGQHCLNYVVKITLFLFQVDVIVGDVME